MRRGGGRRGVGGRRQGEKEGREEGQTHFSVIY